MTGARIFVLIVFGLLGASFIAGTAALAWEFWQADWFEFAAQDSHVFLFFPILGIVALVAFFLPSMALVDLYWRHMRFGKARFLLGILVLAALSYLIGHGLSSSPAKSVWDVAPAALKADRSEPPGCGAADRPCERVALLQGIESLSRVSGSRIGLQDFVRACSTEPLLEPAPGPEQRRFCFAATPWSATPRLSTTAECCTAQRKFQDRIGQLYADPRQHSMTGKVHAWVLPLKVFFLLILLTISLLLAVRHEQVANQYPRAISRIEVGVLVGAIVMLFFPLMSQAFVQTSDALYGGAQETGFKPIVDVMSLIFGVWVMLIVLFFFRRHSPEVEIAVKLAGVLVSAIAIVKFDLIVALTVRFLGSGANEFGIAILVALALVSIFVIATRRALFSPRPALRPVAPGEDPSLQG